MPSLTPAMALFRVKTLPSAGTAETTESHDGPALPPAADVGPVPVWNRPSGLVKQLRSCWSRVCLAWVPDASGAEARPGSAGSTASVGVSPIQCRWKIFSLSGLASESA